ncbi:MAG: glycosyltransferase family 25 protein [Limnohabitans sp.]|jgi:glycosyl transferase family 25|uniref:glycosyltransferase family 25 protein n=1 Tax=Limnohabitans sp. TaxID=1907725 RepID=UPI00391C690A
MKILIISLLNNSRRRSIQIAQMTKFNLDFEFIDAIHYSKINSTDKLFNTSWTRSLPKKDFAIFLSHKLAWSRLLELNQPCIIIEDDCLLHKDIATVIPSLRIFINDAFRVFDLEYVPRKHNLSKSSIDLGSGFCASEIYENKNGLGAYAINQQTASRLLSESSQFHLVDAFVWNRNWIKSYQIEPALGVQEIYITPTSQVIEEWDANINMLKIPPVSKVKSKIRSIYNEFRKTPKLIMGVFWGQRRSIKYNPDDHFKF